MKFIIYVFALFTTFCINAKSQETSPLQKLKSLDFLMGKWAVTTELRLSAQGPWEKSGGTSIIAKVVGETIIEENYSGTHQGKAYFTRSMFAVNNMTMKYQLIFADSDHGVMIDYEGEGTDSSFIFDKTWSYANKSTVKLRTVYTIISKNEFRIENMRMPQGSTSWDVTGRKKYTRS
jgi:hypothetical protein